MALKSLNFYVGFRLVEAAKLAAENLGMKLIEHKEIIGEDYDDNKKVITKSYYKITGKNKEYEIRDDDEYNNDQFGGFYRNVYSLYKNGNLAVDTFDYARWNQFDETVELKHSTELYVEDDLTKGIFDILEGK